MRRSSLIAGAIAAVIYFVIALLTGGGFGSALLVAVLLGLFTFVVSFLIGSFIQSRKRRSPSQ